MNENFFSAAANNLYRLFVAPKKKDEDERRKEVVLNVILIFSIVILAALNGSLVYQLLKGISYPDNLLWIIVILLALSVILLWLSRIGWLRLAIHGLVFSAVVATAYASLTWGANFQHALLASVLVITMASILVGALYGVIVAGIISIITIILWDLQIRAIVRPDWFWQYPLRSRHAVDFVVLFFAIAGVLWLSNREAGKTLSRARHSENALREELEFLERQIKENSRELKGIQLEQMAQMYRLAEFGKLSSGIFHDLVNPLAAVVLTVEDLKDRHHSHTQETRAKIDDALRATDRMKYLVAAIGKQLQNPLTESITFSAKKEIADAVAILAYKARSAKVSVAWEDSKGDAHLFGSPLRFHQVVTNIIANAIDACEYRPSRPPGICKINLKKEDNATLIRISNNGPRIPADIIGRIFESFFTTKPANYGKGIGLSISKEIVKKEFGGEIQVISTDTETVFTIFLPNRTNVTTNIPLPAQG